MAGGCPWLAACDGPQSALDPAGHEARAALDLLWVMGIGAAVVWLLVIGTAVYATRVRRHPHDRRLARWFLLGGGVAFPVVTLALLLGWGLSLMSDLRAAEGELTIRISGEQWWWRVRYETPDGAVEAANELRLPAGRSVELILDSPDVIHAFWVPSIAGKMDMIPGRTTRMVLQPTRTGVFRGACAEFCGPSHALMAMLVEVVEPAAFDAWLAREARPAVATDGAGLFEAVGCGACHTVRGTGADGTIGPDLTHLGSRLSLAAGTLPLDRAALLRWIADPASVKPGARMPAFGALGPERLGALADYLLALR